MKEYLSQKGIKYEECDVAMDRNAAKEMIEKSKQIGVPVVIVDDKDIVVGFDQAKLDELLS